MKKEIVSLLVVLGALYSLSFFGCQNTPSSPEPQGTATVTPTSTATATVTPQSKTFVYTASAYEDMEDAQVRNDYPDTSYPSNTVLSVGKLGSYQFEAFMYFSVTQVAAGSDIISAYLKLYNCSIGGSAGEHVFDIDKVTGAWDDSTLTWNTRPTTAYASSLTAVAGTLDIALDLDMIQTWVDNSAVNYGMRLYKGGELLQTFEFAASESASKPELTIYYY